ncbi:MAG: energy transducer TonB [Candidatus Binatia bacterium]
MAEGLQERSFLSSEERGKRLWAWVFFSGLLHATLIWSLFVISYLPPRRAPSYPIYSVELVGGEKLGGASVGSVAVANPPTREEPKKTKVESLPQVQPAKKEKRKAAENPVQEKISLKESKKELKKELPAEKGLPDQVRDKLIQSALERVKTRAETEQKTKKGNGVSSAAGEGEGAASLGAGGKGGGTLKGLEFVRYYNLMRFRIRESWTWVGKRSDLEVTVRFGIQDNGEIVGLKIVQGSGEPSYDDSVFRAVRKVSPLPPPPEGYRKDFMDVELTFRPKDLGG